MQSWAVVVLSVKPVIEIPQIGLRLGNTIRDIERAALVVRSHENVLRPVAKRERQARHQRGHEHAPYRRGTSHRMRCGYNHNRGQNASGTRRPGAVPPRAHDVCRQFDPERAGEPCPVQGKMQHAVALKRLGRGEIAGVSVFLRVVHADMVCAVEPRGDAKEDGENREEESVEQGGAKDGAMRAIVQCEQKGLEEEHGVGDEVQKAEDVRVGEDDD